MLGENRWVAECQPCWCLTCCFEPCCELANCVHVKRLRARVDELGAILLSDEESSIVHQVHAVSSVEDSIFMESSLDPQFLKDR